jgi:hypothetical protein
VSLLKVITGVSDPATTVLRPFTTNIKVEYELGMLVNVTTLVPDGVADAISVIAPEPPPPPTAEITPPLQVVVVPSHLAMPKVLVEAWLQVTTRVPEVAQSPDRSPVVKDCGPDDFATAPVVGEPVT